MVRRPLRRKCLYSRATASIACGGRFLSSSPMDPRAASSVGVRGEVPSSWGSRHDAPGLSCTGCLLPQPPSKTRQQSREKSQKRPGCRTGKHRERRTICTIDAPMDTCPGLPSAGKMRTQGRDVRHSPPSHPGPALGRPAKFFCRRQPCPIIPRKSHSCRG